MLRHRVTAAMREFLDGEGFLDIETPVLTRSTPEGARDFLVPSRLQQGSFYALPQSPQLFKQLLMVAGFERYYQIARCFRDEDLRADRQPDFTQLDIEMSFVGVDDVIEVNERLLAHVFERVGGPAIELPFARLPYDEAMSRFGTDRPDMRFGLELVDLGRRPGARPSSRSSARRSSPAAPCAGSTPARRELPRSELDGLISRAQELGAKGLVWAFREGDGWRSPTAKFLSDERAGASSTGASAPRRATCCCSSPTSARVADAVLGAAAGRAGGALRPDPGRASDRLVWIVDWPLLEWNAGEERWDPLHHPFTAPGRRVRPRPTRAARGRSPTTSSGTGRRWAAARSASTAPTSRSRSSPRSGSTPRRPRRASASCSRRCATARRRTAASPTGSTASSQRLAGADSIRDVIAFPKTASGADAADRRPRSGRARSQLRELGHLALHQAAACAGALTTALPGRVLLADGVSGHDLGRELRRPPSGSPRGRRPGPGKTPVHVDDPASTRGRSCATSATCARPGPGTRRWTRPGSRPSSPPTGRSTASAAATSPCGSGGEDWSEAELLLSNLD